MKLDEAGLAAAVAAMERCKAPPMETKREANHTTITVYGVSLEELARAGIAAYFDATQEQEQPQERS